MDEFIELLRSASDGALSGVSDGIVFTMFVVIVLLAIASVIAFGVSVWLFFSYVKYNRTANSAGKTGEQVARRILDENGLERIKVSKNGSILFGNSYSHYFKKVRLRRLTWKKDSVTSLTMAAQKSSLAVLDKTGDADMKKRIRLTPIIYFGPLAFIPMLLIGVILDLFVFNFGSGICTIIFTCLGLALYVASFVMSVLVLKTEKKAQALALEIMKKDGLATDEEIEMSKKLFRLYNIEYINDMVVALLELVYRVLQIIAFAESDSSAKN